LYETVVEQVEADRQKPRRLSQYWSQVVREVVPHLAQEVEDCGKHYWTLRAEDGCQTHVKRMCRKDAWCYADSYRRTMELTNDFVRLVAKLSGQVRQKVRFWRIELTIPRDIQSRMTLEDGYEFGKQAQEYIESYLRERFGIPKGVQMGSSFVFQFVHSSDPFGSRAGQDRRHLHYHAMFLGWGVSKKDLSAVTFPQMFVSNDPKFKLLRAGWRSILEARWGKTSANDIDAYIRYESGVEELFHRTRYMFRGAVEDFVKYSKDSQWGYSRDWVKQALMWKQGRPRVRYFGFLSPRNLSPKNLFMQKVSLEIPKKSIRVKEAKRAFCDHGYEFAVQFHEGLKTLDEIIEEGGMVLVRHRRRVVFDGG